MRDKSTPAKNSASQTEVAPLFQVERWPRAFVLLLLPLALWVWLCRDWPLRLGFYSDDWMVLLHPFVGTAGAFHDVANIVATRPASAPYIWLAQLIVDWSPVRSQILNVVMLLTTAASVGLLAAALISVVRGLRPGALAGACVASAAFVVFPSTVGTFAWGTGVTTAIPAVPLFCLATSLLLHSEDSWWRLFLGLALALLSHLSYEAFYFQEIIFILLAATLRGSTPRDVPWRVLVGAVIVNVACLAFNRLNLGGIQKSFHWDFLSIFIGGYSHILAILGHAVREHRLLIAGTILISGPSGAICLARFLGTLRVHLAFLLTVCGVITAGFLYAFAGYGLSVEGVMARVSIVLATYCSIVAGVLAAAAWCKISQRQLSAITFCLTAAISLIALELTARARVNEWADTWSYETARLDRLPVAMTSGGGAQRIYVAVEGREPSAIQPATAPWEITGAVAWASYKKTNSRLLTSDIWRQAPYRWFATPPGWFNRWNGNSFEQGVCSDGAVIYSARGSELWSWNTSGSQLARTNASWEYGCR